MNTSQVIVFAILVLASMSLAARAGARRFSREHYFPHSKEFDFFLLVQQWGAVDNSFTIHGLWPTFNPPRYWPEECFDDNTLPYNETITQEFADKMKRYWPSYKANADDFYGHEYEKHGTCASLIPATADQRSYISKTLELYEKFNLNKLGLEAGAPYTLQQLVDKVVEFAGAIPRISCRRENNLAEIQLCLSKDTFEPFDCEEAPLLPGKRFNANQCNEEHVTPVYKRRAAIGSLPRSVSIVEESAVEESTQSSRRRGERRNKNTRAKKTRSNRKDFDYFLLVLQWGAVDNRFTIHGLWPTYNGSNSWPEECWDENTLPYRTEITQEFADKMDEYWPSYKPDADGFYRHEYERHGTCATRIEETKDQRSYFAKTLALYEKYDLNTLNLQPGEYYDFEHLQKLFAKFIGAKPKITCKGGESLNEVQLCLTPEFKPFECTELNFKCQDEITLRYKGNRRVISDEESTTVTAGARDATPKRTEL